jgi:hypothetical protein
MDYERKYKEALERAKEIIECSKNPGSKEVRMVLSFFPELRENEDERIRKELLDIAKTLGKSEWIAWLEKQGEPPKHDVCDNCDQQGNCVSPCCVKLVEKNSEQKPAEWSNDYERYISYILTNCMHYAEEVGYVEEKNNSIIHQQAKDWLKALKERVQSQPKQEWSKEDEEISKAIIKRIKGESEALSVSLSSAISWVGNIKDRVQLQNQWKPSDGQMEALKEACDEHWEPDGLDPLYTLYQDLKKLKE